MANQEGLFIQEISCDGVEIDLALLQSCTLIETLDLSGPKLIISFFDRDSVIKEDAGVNSFSELKITFADWWNDSSDVEFVDYFIVLTMPTKGETITLNCIQKNIQLLKSPTTRAQIFTQRAPVAIMRALCPGVACVADGFPVGENYHLLPGERSSVVLRQLAREQGARIFYQRGKLYMRKVRDIFSETAEYTYAYENRQAELQILKYTRPNIPYVVEDVLLKSFCGWHITKGMLCAQKYADRAVELSAYDSIGTMKNLSVVESPEVDFTIQGYSRIKPGISLGLEWNVYRVDLPLDESLPEKIVTGVVAHNYSEQKYYIRAKGILPL